MSRWIACGAVLVLIASLAARFGWWDGPDGWGARLLVIVGASLPAALALPGLVRGSRSAAITASLIAMAYALYAALGLTGPDPAWYAWVECLAITWFWASLRFVRSRPEAEHGPS